MRRSDGSKVGTIQRLTHAATLAGGGTAGLAVPGPRSGPANDTRQFNRACQGAAQMAEINKRVSLHTLRHSFATHLLQKAVHSTRYATWA